MNTVSLQLSSSQIASIFSRYKKYKVNKEQPYIQAQYKLTDCVITVYESKKVVFQGKEAEFYAATFQDNKKLQTHAGSDEVGTGDYFGPVCVCACIVDEKHHKKIPLDRLKDSKKIKDIEIMELAPLLIQVLPHSLLILNNLKYNEIHPKYNLNQIKAILHNQTYIHLQKKVKKLPNTIIIDQFTPQKNYYKYLQNEPAIITGIHFETKAEDKYLAVACASVIARYAFLKAFDEMCEKYSWNFLKGASDSVDKNAAAFIKQFGEQELKNVAKLHFKNTIKLKEYI